MRVILASVFALFLGASIFAQSPTGSIGGIVFDADARTIPGAEIIVVNDLTRVQYETKTNDGGIYAVPNLPPGPYRVQASKVGFKTLIKPDIILNVQDAITVNFTLPIGATSIAVTVEGGAPIVNTTDATVSTVVDRQFAENLPMNGRSFQGLIQLTPGVVFTASTANDSGQFSVNGQRAGSNYWMVDGVGANIGIGGGPTPGNGLGGTLGSFSTLGGTNSLVSIDAMQEFRILTSTFAPEFGRTPGGQISIVTRSGTNQFRGTAFDYLRNGALDANNWFADENKLAKPVEKQNDFGGTFSGPIRKDRAFFFFSYEGLRLRLPQTTLTTVPDPAARAAADPAVQPYLNAFPLPNGPAAAGIPGVAQFNSSYVNPASLDAYSLRVDDHLSRTVTLFGRYNYSPSQISQRGGEGDALSTVLFDRITTQTATVGLTWLLSSATSNDFRFNYSHVSSYSSFRLDNYGGAVPLGSLPFPSPYSQQDGQFEFGIFSLTDGFLIDGANARNVQRQMNFVDGLSMQKGSHALKFGSDFRRLAPIRDPFLYEQAPFFLDVPSAEAADLFIGTVESDSRVTLLFNNLSFFAQDTWRAKPSLTLTYGLRWDLDVAPSSSSGPSLAAVTGYNLANLSSLALAPPGTAPFNTTYGNFAPRIGVAYQISSNPTWQSVVRGGFGVFYDLVDSETGNVAYSASYPFGANHVLFGPALGGTSTFPFSQTDAARPAVTPSNGILAFDPHLRLPYTLQWNVTLEQVLGETQTISASYLGAAGRRLLQSAWIGSPNPTFSNAQLVGDTATSDYNSLQIQFQRRLSRGLQALASYTWSHSIDDASAGSFGNFANTLGPGLNLSANRGPSDFDVRNGFSTALTYDIPTPRLNSWGRATLGGWAVESIVQARSALPVNLSVGTSSLVEGNRVQLRPDVVAGQSLYLLGAQYPGGKAFNPAAFTAPPADPTTGEPRRQGDLGRNALRGFGATQWDLAVHREFRLRELARLQFRAEFFNVLNHPSFGPPVADLSQPNFGLATETLGQYLAGQNVGGGGFNSLYQTGGPRSIQLALKFIF